MSQSEGRRRVRRAGVITAIAAGALALLPGAAMADTITGGPQGETLSGTLEPDTIHGRGGDDLIRGGGGPDTLWGNRGADRIFGGRGPDTIYGGRGDDVLVGGSGQDTLHGGGEDDRIHAAGDGRADTVTCGPGEDVAIVDASDDVASDCEEVWSAWRVARIVPWYGPGFYGNRTACGQTMTKRLRGVAHRNLPCGTRIQLRKYGITVTTKVVDRGPYPASDLYDDMPLDLTARTNCWDLNPDGSGTYQSPCPSRERVKWRIWRA